MQRSTAHHGSRETNIELKNIIGKWRSIDGFVINIDFVWAVIKVNRVAMPIQERRREGTRHNVRPYFVAQLQLLNWNREPIVLNRWDINHMQRNAQIIKAQTVLIWHSIYWGHCVFRLWIILISGQLEVQLKTAWTLISIVQNRKFYWEIR